MTNKAQEKISAALQMCKEERAAHACQLISSLPSTVDSQVAVG